MMHWLQVLLATASVANTEHWSDWLKSRGIYCELRRTHKGVALFRTMSKDEYKAYQSIKDEPSHSIAGGNGEGS